jgi:hypothetical protein
MHKHSKPEDGGLTAKIKFLVGGHGQYQEVEIDNQWIFPYCPLLSLAFNAHISTSNYANLSNMIA